MTHTAFHASRRTDVLIRFGCLVLVLALQGCLLFMPSGPSLDEVDRAYQREDLVTLQEWCEIPNERADGVRAACVRSRELEERQQRNAERDGFMQQMTCENTAERFAAYTSVDRRANDVRAVFRHAGRTLATCNDYDQLFGELYPIANADTRLLAELLSTLHNEGVDVVSELVRFTASHPLEEEAQDQLARAAADFLYDNDIQGCGRFAGALNSGARSVVLSFLRYVARTRCVPAGSNVARLLTSADIDIRKDACYTLGMIGDTAHRRAVQRVAEHDGSSVVVDGALVYPVRDVCNNALARLAP